MKNHFLIIYLFLLSNILSAQEGAKSIYGYKNDTLQGKYFDDFYRPTVGLIKNDTLNLETPYFIKCKGVESEEDRRNCLNNFFYEYLHKKLRVSQLVAGSVHLIVEFNVNEKGKVEDIKILKSNDITGEFKKEVVRVLKKLPKLFPAKKDGKVVKVTYEFPINIYPR